MDKKLALLLTGLILSIYSVSAQTSLCDLPPDTPKPESCNTGLNYNILESEITDKTTDQDIFIPRVKIDTNAENVYIEIGSKTKQLYNDGNHEDYAATDQWYGNSIDISNTIGEKNIILKLEKGTETETKHLQTTKFKRTPPEPDIDAEFNDQGLLIQITDTNYPEETSIEIETSVTNEGNTKIDKKFSINCKSDCTRQVSFNPESGDKAEIDARQTYKGLTGDKETKTLTYAGEPSIEAIKY